MFVIDRTSQDMSGNIREREVTRLPTCLHEARPSDIFNPVHQSISMYLTRRLVVLSDASLEYRCLVELPVVCTQLADNPVMPVGLGIWIATDTAGINRMILRKASIDTGMLGDVAVCLEARNCIVEQFFKLNKYQLPHDSHYGSILQGSAAFGRIGQLDFAPMVLSMAFRT